MRSACQKSLFFIKFEQTLNPHPPTPSPREGAYIRGLPPLRPCLGLRPKPQFCDCKKVYRQSEIPHKERFFVRYFGLFNRIFNYIAYRHILSFYIGSKIYLVAVSPFIAEITVAHLVFGISVKHLLAVFKYHPA